VKPLTIRIQIALLTGGLLLLILTGFSVYLYLSFSTQLHQALDDSLRNSAEKLLVIVDSEGGRLRFDEGDLQAANLSYERDDVIRLVSPAGELLDDWGEEQVPITPETLGGGVYTVRYQDIVQYQDSVGADAEEELEQDPAQDDEAPEDDPNETEVVRLLSVPIEIDSQVIAYLQVGRDLEPLQETLARLRTLLFISEPILALLAALAGYWLAGRTLAPIESIRAQAASISARDLSRRLRLTLPDDEVGRLARTFNDMLARLDESFRRQRRFTADASHELRTPLAVIRGEVDVTLEQPRTPAEYEESLRSIGAEAERMSRLANELLLLARGDADELPLEQEEVDLADLLTILAEQIQGEARAANVTLATELPASLLVWGDRDRLLQLFINLLENAFTYAPDSRVTIQGRMDGDSVIMAVTDTGPGIPSAHLPHLFERFYRADKARSRANGGSGLGLAIAQEIVHAHGGTLDANSQVGQGTTFTVRLPRSIKSVFQTLDANLLETNVDTLERSNV
jgi:heavy metal sensor kinase